MTQPDLEIPVSEIKIHFNKLFDVTMTDIRRAFMVKSAALDRAENEDPRTRASGYYHLSKVVDLQLGVYGNYLERFGKVRLPPDAQEKLAQLEELEEGFIKGYFIKRHITRFRSAVSLLEEKFPIIHRKVSVLYQIVMNQRELVKVAAYHDQEAGQISLIPSKEELRRIRKSRVSAMSQEEMLRLYRLLEEEESHSNELIRELKESRDIFIEALDAVGPIQKSFADFLKSARDFRDEREQSLKSFFSKAVIVVSAYYAIKVISVWGAESILNFSNDEEFKALIFIIQHKVLLYDNLADTLAMSPAVVAIVKSGIPALKGIVGEGLNKCKQAYKQGEVAFSSAVQQLLYARKNVSKVPDFL